MPDQDRHEHLADALRDLAALIEATIANDIPALTTLIENTCKSCVLMQAIASLGSIEIHKPGLAAAIRADALATPGATE